MPRRLSYSARTSSSGLRADEIRNLDLRGAHRDVFYERSRIQTRYGKGTRGSGKRIRKTIFTPFAQATVKGHISPSVVHRYVKHSRLYYEQAIDRVLGDLIPISMPEEVNRDGDRVEPEEVARS